MLIKVRTQDTINQPNESLQSGAIEISRTEDI